MSDEVVVAALGDSITAGTPLWDPDPAVRARIGARLDETSSWPYWAERAHTDMRFQISAVDGERTDEIALRLDDCAPGADVLVVQGGINDLVQGRSPADAVEHLQAMVRAGLARGMRVAVAEVLPWNNGWPDHEEPIRRLNDGIAEIAQAEGAVVLPFYATLEDGDRPGRMRPEWTEDGNHPTPAGHRRLGELAFRLP
jgi:lysophospholipase L1-like esterase